jgi:hypothetical protein
MQTGQEWEFRPFTTVEELSTWLTENNKTMADMQIGVPLEPCTNCIVEGATTTEFSTTTTDATIMATGYTGPTTTDTVTVYVNPTPEVEVKSLSEAPSIKVNPLTEGQAAEPNVWHVDNFESMKDACGTCEITYKGDTLLMNVCESEGKASVNLVLEIAGEIKHVPFQLKKACEKSTDYDMILSL